MGKEGVGVEDENLIGRSSLDFQAFVSNRVLYEFENGSHQFQRFKLKSDRQRATSFLFF